MYKSTHYSALEGDNKFTIIINIVCINLGLEIAREETMKAMTDILKSDPKNVSVTTYQNYIADLYQGINKRRSFSDVYGYVDRNIGYLGKSIEFDQNDKSKFILLLSWFFSLSTFVEINALEAIVKKFPGICPYCLQSTCICYRTNKKPPTPLYAFEIKQYIEREIDYHWTDAEGGYKKFNLDETIKYIADIYPSNEVVWKSSGYQSHLLKIHQELAEIHEAYSYLQKKVKPKDAVREEIGDVFAWILGAWAIKYPKESMDKAFIDYYINGCPVCGKFPCACDLEDSRSATLLNFDKIEIIRANIENHFKNINGYEEIFARQSTLYKEVLEKQEMPIVWAALSETKEVLQKIVKTITSIDSSGELTVVLFSTLELIDSLLFKEGFNKRNGRSFDVFLSYANEDKDQARKIYDFLTGKKFEVFMAERSISPGDDWENAIKRALKDSKMMCVLATPSSNVSEWVKTEIHACWILDIPLIPILFRSDIDQLPEHLRKKQCIDFSEYEKIVDELNKL